MRSSNNEDILPIGKITGAHGIKGEVKLSPYGGFDDFSWEEVYLTAGARRIPCRVERARYHKGAFILAIEGYPTRNDAEGLVGFEISVSRDELPVLEQGEYYHFDLIGMKVVDEIGNRLGEVTGIIETGSNDVLEVNGDLGEILLPVIDDVILGVDVEEGTIRVHLLEGLLPGEGPPGD